ncbi:MAG: hypothetical protein R2856_28010 [Caldilineaceae bacterium]
MRGLEEVRINLGTVQPGEPPAIFGDALRRPEQPAHLTPYPTAPATGTTPAPPSTVLLWIGRNASSGGRNSRRNRDAPAWVAQRPPRLRCHSHR